MIKIEKVSTCGWEPALRGMRNPKNSWHLSDSKFYPYEGDCTMGLNDIKLAHSLAQGGPVHAKYRRMIGVYVDITAPLYFWKEFDTYKVGTVSNSCSTMHKVMEKKFTMDDFSCEHLNTDVLDNEPFLAIPFTVITPKELLSEYIVPMLNKCRELYKNETVEEIKKYIWWQVIQLLPSSYNQKRTIFLNYEVLSHMYHDRKDHKLDEWVMFCKWIESLPYHELITTDPNKVLREENERLRKENQRHLEIIRGLREELDGE